ncbi:FecR domain-containing protein [uncultured Pseudodesulfovibrio sp.]|uniref:FecR family protein n=1 Tax=uncultured Pseudodesulfovibrio sp. TaxID=2035858 RepID=UPI0029C85E21|nr:FecR domain-containing protein [uncultured Pseudodesulfovibrio sp.]
MKEIEKITQLLLLTAMIVFLLPLNALSVEQKLPSDAIGEVVFMAGSVRANTETGESRLLELAGPVFRADIIVTGPQSNVEIRFLDETILAQGPKSSLSLDDYVYSTDASASKLLFKMGKGTFRFLTGEIVRQNPEAFNLETPLTTIGIRGTEPFAVVAATEKIGVLSIDPEHTVEVNSPKGHASLSKAGTSTNVGPDGSMSPPAPTPPAVQKSVMKAAPMTSLGETGDVGKSVDPQSKVNAFKQNIAHSKKGLGGVGGSGPDYGALHNITMQQQGLSKAQSDRDSQTGSQHSGKDSGSDSGSSGGSGGCH